MKLNNIKDITNFIFIGKDFNKLKKYDLLIINADWAEESLAKDMKKMLKKNIINNSTTFIITRGHKGGYTKTEKDTADMLISYLNEFGFKNKIIINDKYISNPEIAENIGDLVDLNNYKRILRIAKSFVARRWFITASKYNFPIDKCDFYGVDDEREISKDKWFLSEKSKEQVMKEFINIGQLYLDNKFDI